MDGDSEMFLCGQNRALNPEKYFIILTNLLANGISSSPSNTPAPFDRARFPRITFYDNVRLQHQLVTEELGLKSLRLVTGWSMGAGQTYQWAAQYPDMVRAAAPIAGLGANGLVQQGLPFIPAPGAGTRSELRGWLLRAATDPGTARFRLHLRGVGRVGGILSNRRLQRLRGERP